MIPERWEKHLIGDGIKLISGRHILAKDYISNRMGTPYLTGPTDFQNGKIVATKYTEVPEVLCKPGDSLVTVKGSGTGQVVLSDDTYCISRQLMAARAKKWDGIFVYYALKRNIPRFAQAARGLIPGISREDILFSPILIPPLSEQQKIAEILSTWDKAIELVGKQIEAKQRLKRGLMQQLLTGKMRFPGFGKPVVSNELPEGWREVRMCELGRHYSGLKGKSKKDFGVGKPYIPYLNIFVDSTHKCNTKGQEERQAMIG